MPNCRKLTKNHKVAYLGNSSRQRNPLTSYQIDGSKQANLDSFKIRFPFATLCKPSFV